MAYGGDGQLITALAAGGGPTNGRRPGLGGFLLLLSLLLMSLLFLSVMISTGARAGDIGSGVTAVPETAALARINQPHTRVLVFAQKDKQAGQATLALVFRPEEGWHVYWRNPGDSGLPPKVSLVGPSSLHLGELRFPIPERIPVGPLMNYGYEGEAVFLLPVTFPPAASGEATIRLDWLVCAEVCVPEAGTVTLALAELSRPAPPVVAGAFRSWRSRLPHHLPPGRAEAAHTADRFLLAVAMPGLTAGDVTDAYFYPEDEGVLTYAEPQRWQLKDGRLILAAVRDRANPPPEDDISGLLVLTRSDGEREGFAFDASLTLDPAPVLAALAVAGSDGDGTAARTGFLLALVLAVLGGLLLNLMPCVFPVLSMKAMALLRSAGAGEDAARRDGIFYTLGVVAGFLVLAAILLALKAAGAAVGWGFQLQEPWVVAALAILMFLVGLHFMGWWRLPAGWSIAVTTSEKDGAAHSLFTGLLAAVVATPCTAPFMATALGAAVVMPPAQALAIFAGLGLGLALPYLIISLLPAARRLLPRPGIWMERLQQVLAFPMWLTTVWLVWVLARLTGETAAAWLLAAIVMIGFAVWAAQHLARRRLWAGLGLASAIGFLWLALAPGWTAAINEAAGGRPLAEAAQAQTAEIGIDEQAWSPAAMAEAIAAGRPVFVYFTADWCITCKVNEAVTLENATVRQALAAHHVAVFKADWTHRDPEIATELARHGRDGVPLYLFYRPGTTQPEILPQILTPSDLLTRLADLPPVNDRPMG